jgi:hypothetical protein
VERSLEVEVRRLLGGREPPLVGPFEPREDLTDVLVGRLDPVAEPPGPVDLVEVQRLSVERVGVVHGGPSDDVLHEAEDRSVAAGGVQRLVE